MKLRVFFFSVITISLLIFACSPDDPEAILVPDRDRSEQQVTDNELILEYLQTHYYNSGELENMVNPNVSNIVIDTLDGSLPANTTLLIDDIEVRTTVFEDTEYEYYILRINQGGGQLSPNFTDKVRVEYEGRLVPNFDDEIESNDEDLVFDSAVTPTDFNLVDFSGGGVITGWQRVFPEFNTAASFTTGPNVEYDDFGLGVMFLPSGLAYFSRTVNQIPSYSNLIFKFALFQSEINDHDGDGIPSYIEDINNNLDVTDDDTDENIFFNYIDTDDDGDGVSTRNELVPTTYVVDTNMGETEPVLGPNEYEASRSEDMGVITIETLTAIDSNGNGILDYLEAEVAIDNSDN